MVILNTTVLFIEEKMVCEKYGIFTVSKSVLRTDH